jgi:hypothetical protein
VEYWTKRKIDDVDEFIAASALTIQKGEDSLEHVYCVFYYIDDDNIQVLTIFDFIDYYIKHIITKDNIRNLYSCQPFSKY